MADQDTLEIITTSPRWTILAKIRNAQAELKDYQLESIIRTELGARFVKVAGNNVFKNHVPEFQGDDSSRWVLMTMDEIVENVEPRSLEQCCFQIGAFKCEYSPEDAKAPYPINYRCNKKGKIVTVRVVPGIKLTREQSSLLEDAGIKFATQLEPIGFLTQGRYERLERRYGGLIVNSLDNYLSG